MAASRTIWRLRSELRDIRIVFVSSARLVPRTHERLRSVRLSRLSAAVRRNTAMASGCDSWSRTRTFGCCRFHFPALRHRSVPHGAAGDGFQRSVCSPLLVCPKSLLPAVAAGARRRRSATLLCAALNGCLVACPLRPAVRFHRVPRHGNRGAINECSPAMASTTCNIYEEEEIRITRSRYSPLALWPLGDFGLHVHLDPVECLLSDCWAFLWSGRSGKPSRLAQSGVARRPDAFRLFAAFSSSCLPRQSSRKLGRCEGFGATDYFLLCSWNCRVLAASLLV